MEKTKTEEQKRVLMIKSIHLKTQDELMMLSDTLKANLEELDLPGGIRQEDIFVLCISLAEAIHVDMTGLKFNQLPDKVFRKYGEDKYPQIGYA